MTNLSGYFGKVDFFNNGFKEDNNHYVEYKGQQIYLELECNFRSFCNYSETKNEFSIHSGYGGGVNRYFQLIKKTELCDLERLDYLHNKTFQSLLEGEMCVVRDSFIHCVDLGETVENASYTKEVLVNGEFVKNTTLVNGTILRRITSCPYKSIKLGGYVLIILGYTNNGNTKIVLKKCTI